MAQERYCLAVTSKKTGEVKYSVYSSLKSMLKLFVLQKLKASEKAWLVCLNDGVLHGEYTGRGKSMLPEILEEDGYFLDQDILEVLREGDELYEGGEE